MRAQEMLVEVVTKNALPQGWESETVFDLSLLKSLLGKEILIRGSIIQQHTDQQRYGTAAHLEREQEDLLDIYNLLDKIIDPPFNPPWV